MTLYKGDMLSVLPKLAANSIDSCAVDPPYHLHSIVKRFAKTGRTDKTRTTSGPHQRTARGFMNKTWDGGNVAFDPKTWREVYRVLKPGAFLLCFGGTRTYHRMACAVEDAGFVIYDQIGWAFGQGFPKSHNISKAIDKKLGTAGSPEAAQWEGFGTALKPAWEPIVVARKPIEGTIVDNVMKWGTGALNIDGCRIAVSDEDTDGYSAHWNRTAQTDMRGGRFIGGKPSQPVAQDARPGELSANRTYADRGGTNFAMKPGMRRGRPNRINTRRYIGLPGGSKEPHVATNVYGEFEQRGSYAAGTTTLGRWPANFTHDGSPEVLARFPDESGGGFGSTRGGKRNSAYGFRGTMEDVGFGDSGSAARFFYTAKADHDTRLGSKHPTIKPLDLMQWLTRLVTPPGGTVLDPFAGTGTTGEAAWREGFACILIEREPEYQADIAKRMRIAKSGSLAREVAVNVARNRGNVDLGPLFSPDMSKNKIRSDHANSSKKRTKDLLPKRHTRHAKNSGARPVR